MGKGRRVIEKRQERKARSLCTKQERASHHCMVHGSSMVHSSDIDLQQCWVVEGYCSLDDDDKVFHDSTNLFVSPKSALFWSDSFLFFGSQQKLFFFFFFPFSPALPAVKSREMPNCILTSQDTMVSSPSLPYQAGVICTGQIFCQ